MVLRRAICSNDDDEDEDVLVLRRRYMVDSVDNVDSVAEKSSLKSI